MDSSGSDEIIFWLKDIGEFNTWLPPSVPVSGIHRAVLEGDFLNVKRWVELGEPVNKQEIQSKLTALHMAVIKNDLEILEYLLARDDVDVDIRCGKGKTPLNLATALGYMESVEKLVQAGSDVNIPDSGNNTPLHMSVYCPDACHLLIQNGACVDAVDVLGRTSLHQAVKHNVPEIIYILLYYNADANVPDRYGFTPFMTAINCQNLFAQEILLEYVDDFDRTNCISTNLTCTLTLALHANSPFVKDMIERGVDVNYGDDPDYFSTQCALSACLLNPVDLDTFKLVWERLRYSDSRTAINMFDFFHYESPPTYLQVVIDSDNFEPVVQFFSAWSYYHAFICEFAEREFDVEQLICFTCRLLQYGYRPCNYDIHVIFCYYGHCELLRILLYMDNDIEEGWLPHMAISRLIFDINYSVESVADVAGYIHDHHTLVQLLEYSICPCLLNVLTSKYINDERMSAILRNLPRLPSLIELARNIARKHIWLSYKVTNNCQFYTTIDYLDIPTVYKDILKYERKIYRVK